MMFRSKLKFSVKSFVPEINFFEIYDEIPKLKLDVFLVLQDNPA